MNAIFQSFFQKFLTGLCRICLRAKVRNLVFIICSLLGGIDCVTGKLNEKHALLFSNLVPRMLKIGYLGPWNFKIFWGRTCFDLPRQKRGPMVPSWYSWLLYPTTGYFNFYWNPCVWLYSFTNSFTRMANVECHTKKGCTPFHLACKEGHLQISQQLYEKGADTEVKHRFSLV